ncbi:MAG TPA: fused MFS/spermidine synthase [Acidobacteriaceae bacterium]|jgi:hypothetical protein|nr:fused MFS/spermidine synthase [Acidobacteriaceae bacterium]
MATRSTRLLFGSAIFLGAFLLFAVEPMAAKQLLPALGGSSAVWITCLVFFQVALLLGYLTAHGIGRMEDPRRAAILHIGLLVVAAALLVLIPAPDLSGASAHPLTAIFGALTVTIGLPFLLLAATSPLLQLWLARVEQGAIPWRLFALSNAGSLLALALYPTVIEPHLSLGHQRAVWGCGFGVFATVCSVLAWRAGKSAAPPLTGVSEERGPRTSWQTRTLWFVLPAAASMQLCAVTGHLTQNIAAVPLLWVLPLAAYLLTFIVAFEAPGCYRRWIVVRLLVVMLAALGYMLSKTDVSLPIVVSIGFFLVELFIACWFCHAEAFALRPEDPAEATLFYLLIAGGGAAGTIFVGIGCPLLFDANYDVALAFLGTAAAALAATWRSGWQQRLLWSTGSALMVALAIMLHIVYARSALVEVRNFYGSLRVKQSHWPPQALTVRTLLHGTIEHGTQWFADEYRRTPTTYYADDSGIGLALRTCCAGRRRNIGVVGLGAGTLAAYGEPGDRIRFYEINPAVRPIAENLFSYLRESRAQISFADGDARISLEREAPQNFDVLAIDAFSGDAIPMHLLTTQAIQIYERQLAPGGVLAFHVSNQYVDLAPEVSLLAKGAGMQAWLVDSAPEPFEGEYRATWVLVTKNAGFLQQPVIAAVALPIHSKPGLRAWTDDDSSLLPILRWGLPEMH